METWYLPITVLPGIGFLILSTARLTVSLNEELQELLKEVGDYEELIHKKLKQMRLLTLSQTGLYLSTALFVLSGFVSGIQNLSPSGNTGWGFGIMILGVANVLASLLLLIIYSTKSVTIRQMHFDQCLVRDLKENPDS
ncbi:MAG: DUF2721 domain-containing protein [Balneolaceae bacterium]|nr:DUF2721 domain-containing protein [Balneolaceae bacterium]